MRSPKPIPILLIIGSLVALTFFIAYHIPGYVDHKNPAPIDDSPGRIVLKGYEWIAPDTNTIANDESGQLVRYGKQLVVNTSYYLGPRGSVAAITNGMNCQNCHLEAGTKAWGNNYGGVFSTYPKHRDRSGGIETIYKKVNDCIQRSLNGTTALDSNSREMKAIYAYMQWLGKDVPAKTKPVGSAIEEINFLDRAADPLNGERLFALKCQTCHGPDGKGLASMDGKGFVYPPLWGDKSYTTAAGLHRLTKFAGYIKNNMPNGATHESPVLTDEEAWDIAAFVNSQPRPVKKFKEDWPDISTKPVDHPFGPFVDGFSETQHKYGPFKPIVAKRNEMKKKPAATTNN